MRVRAPVRNVQRLLPIIVGHEFTWEETAMKLARSLILGGLVLVGMAGFGLEAAHAQNPIVGGRGWERWGYDPWRDHWHRDRYRERARESAFDWDRSQIDAGSYRYVDRHVRDEHGQLVREYGPTWTSHGKPHGRLTRERVTHYPGRWGRPDYTERDRDVIIYVQPAGPGTPRQPSSPHPLPRGGVIERDRDVIIYSQPARAASSNR